MLMSEKDRIRTERYLLTLLPEEKALLQKGAFEAGMSQAEYLRKLIVFGGMFVNHFSMDKEQTKQLLYELNRIGNNINQIAFRTNANKTIDWRDFRSMYDNYMELLSAYDQFIRGKATGDY